VQPNALLKRLYTYGGLSMMQRRYNELFQGALGGQLGTGRPLGLE